MKPIKYDRHARRRMKWRKILQEEVEQVITNPDRSELTEKERMNVFKLVNNRLIKVTYKEFENEILVITAVVKSEGGINENRV